MTSNKRQPIFCKNPYTYTRRKTREVKVGDIGIGGSNPIRFQSMTTTLTMDTEATVAQVIRLVKTGCEIVRITTPTVNDAKNLKNIKRELLAKGIKVPLVADIHFLPAAAMEAAEYVEKIRINPGNFADSKLFKTREYTKEEYQKELDRIEERFTPLVLKLKKLGRALRIGTNHGSLSDRIMNRYGNSPEGMVESALEFAHICQKNNFHDIVLSMKSSNPKVVIAAYRLLAARMDELGMDYPFHLGVTEAGEGEDGRIKSAIGIGSLLEDGIGDTIRVSLTEEPECEIPVCAQIALGYQERHDSQIPESCLSFPTTYVESPYRYFRRKTKSIKVGPFQLGGENPVRIVSGFSPQLNAEATISDLTKQLADSKNTAPEIIEWPIRNENDLKNLETCKNHIVKKNLQIAFLGRFEDCLQHLDPGLSLVDWAVFSAHPENDNQERKNKFLEFLKKVKEKKVPILLEAAHCKDPKKIALTKELTPAHNMMNGMQWCEEAGITDIVLSFNLPNRDLLIHNVRLLATMLSLSRMNGIPLPKKSKEAEKGKEYPIHLRIIPKNSPESDYEQPRIDASIALGSLLCDGIGDSVQVGTGLNLKQDLELAYNILQAAGVRITKAEYISCPSCGRTLFDIQSMTEKIRSRTGHLKGVKIAIMGCIVNGPGEMADADFGYVGGAPDKINLYVGKECVEKGIPTESAVDKLIELIKKHNKWQNPA